MRLAKLFSLCVAGGCITGLAVSAHADTAAYLSCALSKGGPNARLYRYAKISDSYRYAVRVGSVAKQPVFDSTDEGDRGSAVKSTCAGQSQARALVFRGEFFGSAYPKGFAIVWNPFVKEAERIDFSEKSDPTHIFLEASGTRVVMPNVGNETASRYIQYAYDAVTRRTVSGPLDELPASHSNILDIPVESLRHSQ